MEYFDGRVFKDTTFLDIKLHHIGEEVCNPGHMFGPVIRNHFIIHYIYSGRGKYHFNTRSDNSGEPTIVDLIEGQAFLIWPGQVHTYIADSKDPWHYTWIEFNGAKAEKILQDCGLDKENLILTPKADSINAKAHIEKQFKYLLNKQNISEIALIGNLYLLFDALKNTSNSSKNTDNDINIKKIYIERACNFIEKNYVNINSVEEIATHCNLSRNYLNKLFKIYLNETIQEHLTNIRLGKCIYYLQNTHMQIGEICDITGFSNTLNFYRCFKNKFGISPTQWRDTNMSKSILAAKKVL